jgi:hypothetical protein
MRTVVDDDDLERRVIARQKGLRALDDQRLLVVGRRYQADARPVRELFRLGADRLPPARVPRDLA